MCTKPIYLNNRSQGIEHALRFVQASSYVPEGVQKYLRPYSANGVQVPCGKCIECLRKRQNDYAIRIAEEAKLKGSFHFVTLTYSENKVPFAVRPFIVDVNSGECFLDWSYRSLKTDENIPDTVRSYIISLPRTKNPRYYTEIDTEFARNCVPSSVNLPDCYRIGVTVSPSLHREHLRLWIKECRVEYKRRFDKELSFTYAAVGEYGSNTCRPHYHICLFGLTIKQVEWMCLRWSSKEYHNYGYTKVKQVKHINKDGSCGYDIASRYVGKYIAKGVFECPSVIAKNVEKPRFQASLGLGLDSEKLVYKNGKKRVVRDLSDVKKRYYLCFDLFGAYDCDTLRFANGQYMDAPTVESICSHIKDRCCYIDSKGNKYALPESFKKRLFYVRDKFTEKIRVSSLRLLSTSFTASDPFEDFARVRFQQDQIQEPCSKDWRLAFEMYSHLLDYRQTVGKSLQTASLREFYHSSKF